MTLDLNKKIIIINRVSNFIILIEISFLNKIIKIKIKIYFKLKKMANFFKSKVFYLAIIVRLLIYMFLQPYAEKIK